MNRRQKIIVSVTGIFLVLLILVGLTYAYFLTRVQGNNADKSISVTTANLALVYADNSSELIKSNTPIVPGAFTSSKTFTVTNEGNATIDSYAVILENFSVVYASTTDEVTEGQLTSLVHNEDMKMNITCKSYKNYGKANQAESGTCTGVSNGVLPTSNDVLVMNSINVGITQEYTLTLNYIDNGNQSADMNKRIEGRINIINASETVDLTGEVSATDVAYVEATEDVTAQQTSDTTDGEIKYLDETSNTSDIEKVENEVTTIRGYVTNNKYKLVGLKPANYEIKLYNSSGSQIGSTHDIEIVKGNKSGITGNKFEFTSISRLVKINFSEQYLPSSKEILNNSGIHSGIIPEGGIYCAQSSDPEMDLIYYDDEYQEELDYLKSTCKRVYNSGESFPQINVGDVYIYNGYEYRNKYSYKGGFWESTETNGWGVATGKEEIKGSDLLYNINGENIISMSYAFASLGTKLTDPLIIPTTVKSIENIGTASISNIPFGVEDMSYAFADTDIRNAPIIPNSVTNMTSAFSGCTSLVSVPVIPNSVTNMTGAFSGCTSLVSAPVIPESVTNMTGAFSGCTSLEGTIEINANLDENDEATYEEMLTNTKIKKITGTISDSLKLKIAAFSNITIDFDGGIYYTNVTNNNKGKHHSNAHIIINNQGFPSEPKDGDVYVFGDYEYKYNYSYHSSYSWEKNSSQNGWGVAVRENGKAEYGEILSSINGKNVTSLYGTFRSNSNLKIVPTIPNTIRYMDFTFSYSNVPELLIIPYGVETINGIFSGATLEKVPEIPNTVTSMYSAFEASNITVAPIIPSSVKVMDNVFMDCVNLTGSIEINANPEVYDGALTNTKITEITGTTSMKDKILATVNE